MIFAADGNKIVRGEITLPRYGDLWADVEFDGAPVLPPRLSLVLGDLTQSCQVERGGDSASVGRYVLRSALAWEKDIKPRPYQSDAGVRLRNVLYDLAKEIGEEDRIDLSSVPMSAKIGQGNNYCRPGSYLDTKVRARDVLSRLSPKWYVDPSGVVKLGDRSGPEIVSDAKVKRRNLAHGIRYVGTEKISAFVPGSLFEGTRIGNVVIHVMSSDATLELWEVDP